MKICKLCEVIKSEQDFYSGKTNCKTTCKECLNRKRREKYISIKNKLNNLRREKYASDLEHKELIKQNSIKYYHKNKEDINNNRKNKYKIDKDYKNKILVERKEYYKKNKDIILERDKKYRTKLSQRSVIKHPKILFCVLCKQEKTKSEFNSDISRISGLSNKCKSCSSKVNAKYREENRINILKQQKQARKINPTRYHNYKVKRKRVINKYKKIEEWQWEVLKYLAKDKCLKCGEKKKLTLDHVVPLSKNGEHSIQNVQPLCKNCNSSKNVKIEDYRTKDILLFVNS